MNKKPAGRAVGPEEGAVAAEGGQCAPENLICSGSANIRLMKTQDGRTTTVILRDVIGATLELFDQDGQRKTALARYVLGVQGKSSRRREAEGRSLCDNRPNDSGFPVTDAAIMPPYYEWTFRVTDGNIEPEAIDPTYPRSERRVCVHFRDPQVLQISFGATRALWARMGQNHRIALFSRGADIVGCDEGVAAKAADDEGDHRHSM